MKKKTFNLAEALAKDRAEKKAVTVPDRLRALGDLYSSRNKVYGDDYIHAGKILAGLFPRGLTIKTEAEFRRFSLFIYMLGKLNRYAQALSRGEGHADSLDDLAVYAQITQETDTL